MIAQEYLVMSEDEVRTVEGGLFYIGRPGGQCLQYGVLGGYTSNSQTNQKRKFTGPRFTVTIDKYLAPLRTPPLTAYIAYYNRNPLILLYAPQFCFLPLFSLLFSLLSYTLHYHFYYGSLCRAYASASRAYL